MVSLEWESKYFYFRAQQFVWSSLILWLFVDLKLKAISKEFTTISPSSYIFVLSSLTSWVVLKEINFGFYLKKYWRLGHKITDWLIDRYVAC